MGNDSYPVPLTQSGTTTLKSCFLYAIAVNKTLTGTLIVKEQGVAMGTLAINTPIGTYHIVPNGVRYSALTLVLSANDDVTVFIKTA